MNKDHYLIQLSESLVGRFESGIIADQPEPVKVFSAIWELESHVNGGGFDEYFRYAQIEGISFIPGALGIVGAAKCREIVERAISVGLGASIPATEELRTEHVLSLTEETREKLYAIDEEFYRYPDSLTDLLFAYVVLHPEYFGPITEVIS